MQLAPIYGERSLVELDGPLGAIAEPAARQRRRFLASLQALEAEAWDAPSRCEGWTARDVVSHLDTTNAFWTFSLQAGLAGRPSRFLTSFDPVASPAQMAADDERSAAEVLEGFAASTEAFCDLICSLDETAWTSLSETPPGHVSAAALAHHTLWDGWVHERDVLLPLGTVPAVEPDEVLASLRYAAALGPALARACGEQRHGRLAIAVTSPDDAFTIDVGDQIAIRSGPAPDADLPIEGDALDLLEAFSLRAPLAAAVPPDHAWLVDGLAIAFDAPR